MILRGAFLEGNSFSDLGDNYWPMALIALTTLGYSRLAVPVSHELICGGYGGPVAPEANTNKVAIIAISRSDPRRT